MSWRILQITKPCRLFVKNSQFSYEPLEENGDAVTIPLEDISVIILEHNQIMLNNSLIAKLAEYDIVMFTCGNQHLPEALFFPFHNHSRYSETAWIQVAASEPFKKRLWQEIVKAKIKNQASCLEACGKENAVTLREIAKQVQSGDAKNTESYAASIYWKSLLKDFNRHNEADIRNAALNYGYAIIRGAMARSVVGAGLLPCFGIHHTNKLNQFNLVDDLMEPLRPFVDYIVYKMEFNDINNLTVSLKNQLVAVLTHNVLINGEEITLLKMTETEALSLAKAFRDKKINELKLPLFKKIPLFE